MHTSCEWSEARVCKSMLERQKSGLLCWLALYCTSLSSSFPLLDTSESISEVKNRKLHHLQYAQYPQCETTLPPSRNTHIIGTGKVDIP